MANYHPEAIYPPNAETAVEHIPLAAQIEASCLASFNDISPYYSISPQLYARAGFSWLGAVDLVGCVPCKIRLQTSRHPIESDRTVVETLASYHRHRAKLARCEWARLDAGVDSARVQEAMDKGDSSDEVFNEREVEGIHWSELEELSVAVHQMLAIVKVVTAGFTGSLQGPQAGNTPRLDYYTLRDMKSVMRDLVHAFDNVLPS